MTSPKLDMLKDMIRAEYSDLCGMSMSYFDFIESEWRKQNEGSGILGIIRTWKWF